MAEFTFYTNPMSRGQTVRWALHEVSADYEAVIIDWQDKPAAFVAANPMGKVPTIVHHAPYGNRIAPMKWRASTVSRAFPPSSSTGAIRSAATILRKC